MDVDDTNNDFLLLLKEINEDERTNIARVVNCISALAKQYMHINDTIIVYTYEGNIFF